MCDGCKEHGACEDAPVVRVEPHQVKRLLRDLRGEERRDSKGEK